MPEQLGGRGECREETDDVAPIHPFSHLFLLLISASWRAVEMKGCSVRDADGNSSEDGKARNPVRECSFGR